MEYIESSFTPINLVSPDVPLPEVEDIWNIDTNGNNIAVKFTEALTGDPIDNEDAFVVTFQEYTMVPEGTLFEQIRTPTGVRKFISVEESVDLSDGTYSGVVCDEHGLRLGK